MKAKDTKRPAVATLEAVARAAGVAPSTVSRALSNPGRVNPVTRALVYKTAKRLGYTVNMAARSLRRGATHMLMLLLPPWSTSPVISEIMHSVEEELVRRGYGLVVGHQSELATSQRHLFELACGGLVDGLLIVAGDTADMRQGKRSAFSFPIPAVGLLIDLSDAGISSVITNDHGAIYAATRHLLEQGRERFLYIGGPTGNYHEMERRRGVVDSLRDCGMDPRNLIARNGPFSLESGAHAAREYLTMRTPPTAVVCANDSIAIGFMKVVRSAGKGIPEDVAVVGFDGVEFGEYCEPTLTTCKQPVAELGRAGVALLLDLIENRTQAPAVRQVIDSTLIIRESTVKSGSNRAR